MKKHTANRACGRVWVSREVLLGFRIEVWGSGAWHRDLPHSTRGCKWSGWSSCLWVVGHLPTAVRRALHAEQEERLQQAENPQPWKQLDRGQS